MLEIIITLIFAYQLNQRLSRNPNFKAKTVAQ